MADPVAQLTSGLARGVAVKHEDGFNYFAFKGIPYAEPPIGNLRFEDPIPVKNWEGTLDCKSYRDMCLQYDFFLKKTSCNEDCLYLNVLTRSIVQANSNTPVMVIVHGGAFSFGSSDDTLHGPEYLIRKDVVLVTLNYRLGILGFLNLEDEIAPGNQGLKDIAMALQWVRRNIRAFDADPDNVTIFGTGAGGAAAHYLAISPLTKGLVHKDISQGSTAFTPWVGIDKPRSNAIKLCSILGRELTDSREIVEFLRSVDAASLQEAQEKLRESVVSCVVIRNRRQVRKSGDTEQGVHMPYLLGHTSDEGIALLSDEGIALLSEAVTHPGKTRDEFFRLCNADFNRFLRYNTADILERYGLSREQLRRAYFKSRIFADNSLEEYAECCGDLYVVEGVHRLAKVLAERNSAPTYLYKFSFDTAISLLKVTLENVPNGACHMDDLPFVFKTRAFEDPGLEYFKRSSREYRLMDQMTEMWTNFARYGRLNVDISDLISVQWRPLADGTLLRYLNLDEDFTMQFTVNVDQKFLSATDIRA